MQLYLCRYFKVVPETLHTKPTYFYPDMNGKQQNMYLKTYCRTALLG